MATAPSNPPKKQSASLPPRRGRVKAQIFESLTGNLSSAASQVLARIRGGSAADTSVSVSASASASAPASASASTSTSTSPPPSAYTSDGYPDQA